MRVFGLRLLNNSCRFGQGKQSAALCPLSPLPSLITRVAQALIEAVIQSDAHEVDRLIEARANVNYEDEVKIAFPYSADLFLFLFLLMFALFFHGVVVVFVFFSLVLFVI